METDLTLTLTLILKVIEAEKGNMAAVGGQSSSLSSVPADDAEVKGDGKEKEDVEVYYGLTVFTEILVRLAICVYKNVNVSPDGGEKWRDAPVDCLKAFTEERLSKMMEGPT